jgi:hypothetical protein
MNVQVYIKPVFVQIIVFVMLAKDGLYTFQDIFQALFWYERHCMKISIEPGWSDTDRVEQKY